MNIQDLGAPLNIDQVEFRVQSINKGKYATILVYKDARADMQRLDEVAGPLNWRRQHLNNNANCIVSIWCDEKKVWVAKEDTGTESNAEAQKGLASDSFKRACVNWGIGRELYNYPVISIKLNDNEVDLSRDKPRSTWDFRLKEWIWYSEFEDNNISFLAARDQNGKTRYTWGNLRKKEGDE